MARDPQIPMASPSTPSGDGQGQGLGKELADDPGPPGAEGRTNRHLPFSRPPPRKEQVGHVHAGHEEYEQDGAQEHLGCGRRHVAQESFASRVHVHGPTLVGFRILGLQLGRDQGQLPFRVRHRGPVAQPGDRAGIMAVPFGLLRRHGEGEKHVRALVEEHEVLGQNADHRVHDSVQQQGPSDCVRVAGQATGPEAVGEDNDAVVALAYLVRCEVPAECRTPAQQLEDVRGHPDAVHQLRGPVSDQVETVVIVDSQVFQSPAPLPPVPGVRGADVGVFPTQLGIGVHDHDQLVRILVGEWREEHAVRNREDRCGRPDAQGQGRDRRKREDGSPRPGPERKPYIRQRRADHGVPSLSRPHPFEPHGYRGTNHVPGRSDPAAPPSAESSLCTISVEEGQKSPFHLCPVGFPKLSRVEPQESTVPTGVGANVALPRHAEPRPSPTRFSRAMLT